MKEIKPLVFLPPFLLMLAVVVLNFLDVETFTAVMTGAKNWVLETFGWLFSLLPFVMLLVCAGIYVSPFGRVIIGGPDAKPLLNKWRWFAITLCTTIAIGILLWSAAEPMFHLSDPPKSLGIEPGSEQAATFAMDTIYLHWTCTPYAIYTIAGLMFAFSYYNMKQPFSLGSPLAPLLGGRGARLTGPVIDAICLYALVAGMAASLGGGMLLIAGGLHHLSGVKGTPLILAVLAAAIVGTFTISAITGLMKGIRILSNINTVFLIGILLFVLLLGPTRYIFEQGARALGHFVAGYVQRNWWTITTDDPWVKAWTVFYWANWFAWAPISVAFLGRIAYGHSVRAFIVINLILPAAFTGFWMAVFAGAAIHLELFQGAHLVKVLNESGFEGVLYAFLDHFPFARVLIPMFLLTAFLSFVTASDSNTSAMSGLSSTGISPKSPEPSMLIKIIWGFMIGLVAWVMVSFAHLDGIRMLSSLGGLPSLFLCGVITICAIMVGMNPRKYDTFKEGYDDRGRPIRRTNSAR